MSAQVGFMSPSGPIGAGFRACEAFLTLIMGPVGSGKTTDCIAKGIQIGAKQGKVWDPTRLGGKGCWVRKCRGAVVRDTYPNLDRTVIKSWHKWFPKEMGRWSGDAPRTHAFTIDMWDVSSGTPEFFQLDMEVIFVAIGDRAVEDVLRGLELTWLWLNEQDLLPRAIIELGIGRVGRYPSGKDGKCLFPQVFGDMNAPEEDNWTVELFIEKKIDEAAKRAFEKRLASIANDNDAPPRPLIEFHRQPGGLEAGAENLQNLEGGRTYYEVQAAIMAPDKARRMIHNRIGPVRKGTLVYPEFVDDALYDNRDGALMGNVRPFDIDPRLPVLIGADQGICPGVVLAQLDPSTDQLRIFDEQARIFENEDGNIVVSQMGGEAFGRQVATLMLSAYPGLSVGLAVADPAGSQGEQAIEGSSWRRDFQRGLGVNVKRCSVPGNSIELRTKAVRDRFGSRVPGQPRLLVHPRCTILRKAFSSRYVFSRVAVGVTADSGRFADKPVKAQGYSDVMNALEYLCFEVNKGLSFSAVGSALPRSQRRAIENDGSYDMFGRTG